MGDKDDKILDILKNEYLSDYIEILGISVGITEYYPQQADSQIRNALTHLARAAINSGQEADNEIEKAKTHIERAKRDCLKLAIIGKKEHLSDHIKSLHFAKGGLPEQLMEKRLQVAYDQRVAFINESKGINITSDLESVLTQLLNIEKEIIEFDKIGQESSNLVRVAVTFIKWGKKLLALLGSAVLVYLIAQAVVWLF
jgi:hypothetical protein